VQARSFARWRVRDKERHLRPTVEVSLEAVSAPAVRKLVFGNDKMVIVSSCSMSVFSGTPVSGARLRTREIAPRSSNRGRALPQRGREASAVQERRDASDRAQVKTGQQPASLLLRED
jgi:hypothetical protein